MEDIENDEEYEYAGDELPSPSLQQFGDEQEADQANGDSNEDEELSPTAKRLKTVVSEREKEIEDLKRQIEKNHLEIGRLATENSSLKSKALTEMLKIQQSHDVMIATFTGYSGVAVANTNGSLLSAQPTKLKQVFNVDEELGEIDSIDDINDPVRFSAHGVFPHAVDLNKKTHVRELQVENRRQITLTFKLVSKLDGRKATEKNVRHDGYLPFKLSILYADDHSQEVVKEDFTKLQLTDMCEPRFDSFRGQTMMNGKVVFHFKFNISSADTTPKGRSFVVKVTPDIDELANNDDLTITTPPFTIRSKVTAPKK